MPHSVAVILVDVSFSDNSIAMQNIIIEKPYQFVPPQRSRFWPRVFHRFRIVDWYLKRYEGVTAYRIDGADHLRESLRQNRGVLLTPNHCRYADPFVMGWVSREIQTELFAMASWHLFEQHWFQRWAIRAAGAFSIYREGVDRQSIDTAIDILANCERPLVVFPEGSVFRTNDQLQALLDGVAFIARAAAKKCAKGKGKADEIVVHPVAIKYLFHGELKAAIGPVLDEIERRMTLIHTSESDLIRRLENIITSLLSIKEVEFLGSTQTGSLPQRKHAFIDRLLHPLEKKWLGKELTDAIVPRIKAVRMKIVPELIQGDLDVETRKSCWRDLSDLYLAQQIAAYPEEYLQTPTTDTRILETVERLSEDLMGRTAVYRPIEAVIEIGEAIPVSSERPPRGAEDPVMQQIRTNLSDMLARLSSLSRPFP